VALLFPSVPAPEIETGVFLGARMGIERNNPSHPKLQCFSFLQMVDFTQMAGAMSENV
jgi:hypothetical protein